MTPFAYTTNAELDRCPVAHNGKYFHYRNYGGRRRWVFVAFDLPQSVIDSPKGVALCQRAFAKWLCETKAGAQVVIMGGGHEVWSGSPADADRAKFAMGD